MKTVCPHCGSTLPVNPIRRIRDVSCPSCNRLVFREERVWGKLWSAVCVLSALAAGVVIYQRTANIYRAWTVYVNYLVPAAIVLVLAPLGNLVMFFVHQAKNRK